MALRIIRKSASQSHVEVIKGTNSSQSKPQMSLMLYVQSAQDLEAFKQWIYQTDSWIQGACEVVVMKARELDENIRLAFSPVVHNCKLLQEPEQTSVSKRLRMLTQESVGDTCVYLSSPPLTLSTQWLESLNSHLQTDPNRGIVGPVLTTAENQVLSAGYTLPPVTETHELAWEQETCLVQAKQDCPLPLFHGLPFSQLQSWALPPLKLSLLPLNGLAFKRTAYLDLNWEDQPWDETLVAFDLCLSYRQAQYWVHLLPVALPVASSSVAMNEIPAQFLTKYPSDWLNELPQIYEQCGFSRPESASRFFRQGQGSILDQHIEHYLAKAG